MNFSDMMIEQLIMEGEPRPPSNMNGGILLLDIDDTLLSATGMHIYRTDKHPDGAAKLTPAQYAKETVTPETKSFYDYKDFRDEKKVLSSIVKGNPIIKNLKIMDNYMAAGWKIGILTARGMEDTIYKALKGFLKYRKNGVLTPIGNKLQRKDVHAINDSKYSKDNGTDYEKKANVLLAYRKEFGTSVKFLDDDTKNLVKARTVLSSPKDAIQAHEARPKKKEK